MLKGEIQNVVGVDIPFFKPNADIILPNDTPKDLEQKVQSIFNQIKEKGSKWNKVILHSLQSIIIIVRRIAQCC